MRMQNEIIVEESIKSDSIKDSQETQKPDKRYFNATKEIKLLNDRLDSQSKRINKLQSKLAQTLVNQRYYMQKRLPLVLERERAKIGFSEALRRAEQVLRVFDKNRLFLMSNSRNKELKKERYIGMFTHVEMQRLRNLLAKNLSVLEDDKK